MNTKEAIKEAIRKALLDGFDHYISDGKLEEAGWEFLKSKLGLVGWDRNLYYTRSKAIDRAQATLWEKIEDLADEYGLDAHKLWEDHIIEPAMMLDNSYEDILKEKGLKYVVEYVGVGYDDREGGFLVFVSPKVVMELLDANVDEVAEEFVKGISEKDLEKLEQEYWKKVEEYKEEGWEVDEKEILEKVAEDYLFEREEELAWLYVEKSEDVKKFVEAVEEMEKGLVAYLSDVDYWEEIIRDILEEQKNKSRNKKGR